MRRHITSFALLVVLFVTAGRAAVDDIVVMTSGAFTGAYLALSKAFAGASGQQFITAATSMDAGSDSIPARLAAGEPVDLVIVAAGALEQLTREGRIVPGSRRDLARSSIALAVKSGTPRPDISTVDALERALPAAKSLACSGCVSGDYLVQELFTKLGIANEMRSKTLRVLRERVGAVVARGDADIGVQQLSELRSVGGVDVVGLLPQEVQRVAMFSAGISSTARHPEIARAFLAYITSPAVRAVIEATGLDPIQ